MEDTTAKERILAVYGASIARQEVETMDRTMKKTEIMQLLWRMSEEADKEKDKILLEAAGNLIESTFDSGSIEEGLEEAVCDARIHLLELELGNKI